MYVQIDMSSLGRSHRKNMLQCLGRAASDVRPLLVDRRLLGGTNTANFKVIGDFDKGCR
jgi:hypothetical protein